MNKLLFPFLVCFGLFFCTSEQLELSVFSSWDSTIAEICGKVEEIKNSSGKIEEFGCRPQNADKRQKKQSRQVESRTSSVFICSLSKVDPTQPSNSSTSPLLQSIPFLFFAFPSFSFPCHFY